MGKSEDELAIMRRRHIGIVFQFFNLLEGMSVLENVTLPAVIAGAPRKRAETRARDLLDLLGLADKAKDAPGVLSGGQRQRLAIARALANEPTLLLADEPTGALDSEGGHEVLELFRRLHAGGQTILMVTHDDDVAAAADRIVRMRDGRIETEAEEAAASAVARTPSRSTASRCPSRVTPGWTWRRCRGAGDGRRRHARRARSCAADGAAWSCSRCSSASPAASCSRCSPARAAPRTSLERFESASRSATSRSTPARRRARRSPSSVATPGRRRGRASCSQLTARWSDRPVPPAARPGRPPVRDGGRPAARHRGSRWPTSTQVDEVNIGETLADSLHLEVGDRLPLRVVLEPADIEARRHDAEPSRRTVPRDVPRSSASCGARSTSAAGAPPAA